MDAVATWMNAFADMTKDRDHLLGILDHVDRLLREETNDAIKVNNIYGVMNAWSAEAMKRELDAAGFPPAKRQ